MVRSPPRRENDSRRREHRSRSRDRHELLPHTVRQRNDDRDGDRMYSSQSRYQKDHDRTRDRDRDRDKDRDRDRERDRDRDRDRDRRGDRRPRLSERERSPRHQRDHRDDARKTSRSSRSPPSRRRHSPHRPSPARDSRKRTRSPSPAKKEKTLGDDHSSKRLKTERSTSPRRSSSRRRSPPRRDEPRRADQEPAETAAEKEERLKKERLKRVEVWKQKQAAKKLAAATDLQSSEGADKGPLSATTASPAPLGSPTTTDAATPQPHSPSLFENIPDQPGRRFDYKSFARPSGALAPEKLKKTLDGGVVMPQLANGANGYTPSSAPIKPTNAKSFGANQAVGSVRLSTAANSKSDRAVVSEAVSGLEDEVVTKRKLEKLPDLPHDGDVVDMLLNDADDGDHDELEDDEEREEAAREAAQRRALAQTEQQDTVMTDAVNGTANDTAMEVDEEEIDPLDAFMSTLDTSADITAAPTKSGERAVAQRFDGDDEPDLDAVGDGTDDFLALAAVKRKKRDVPVVDHSKIEYEDFRRDFYTEPQEYRNPKDRDVDDDRYIDLPLEDRHRLKKEDQEQLEQDRQELARDLREELDGITIQGKNPPLPIQNWTQAGFGTKILDVVRDMKFEKPTAIQCQALPAIMSGRDMIGIAKTGSGKTLAFVLPMFRHIMDQRPLENMEGPIGLILAPTRELAVQIQRECRPFCKALGIRAVCAYGGAPIKDQIAEVKRGAEIIIATAGRLIDLLIANAGRVLNLRRVTYMVMDEADRMFDMGFEPQISKIMKSVRPDRQLLLFSATFRSNMEALARAYLKRPLQILVGGRSVVAKEVTQQVEVVADADKFLRTLKLLGDLYSSNDEPRTLIFVDRQETADNMNRDLAARGYPCVSIHGGREQIDRDQAISDFKAGHFPVMVATSVAARGLDVKDLKLVINFDSPNHAEDYVHRCGRTGRAGNTGTAVTFVTPEQSQYARFLARCLTDSGQEVPEELKKLHDEHEEKVKAGEARKGEGGFGGRGIDRLQAARDAERARERKQYKTGDEPEEEDEEQSKDKDKKISKVDELMAKATGAVRSSDAPASATDAPSGEEVIPTSLVDALNNAMKVQKAEKPDKPAFDPKDPLARVNAAAASINSRLGARGVTRTGQPVDNRGPDAGAFHATLEINDFPQKARWAVTNRTNVAKILESTGTSITSKGQYYKTGTAPQEGDPPKIYVLVEGDTEVVVGNAMTELTKLLRDGAIAHYEQEARGGAGVQPGRYNVV